MFPPSLLLLFFSSLLTLSTAALPPAPLTPLSKPLTITAPDGTSLSILQSIGFPNFGIANVWPNGGHLPTWLRPVDPAGTNILLDLTIATYATRPSDGIAGYGTIGPESSPLLKGIEERVVVKQWVKPSVNGSRILAAPVRNRDVAYAAEMWVVCVSLSLDPRGFYQLCTRVSHFPPLLSCPWVIGLGISFPSLWRIPTWGVFLIISASQQDYRLRARRVHYKSH